jgi:hypothetical protein
LLLAYAAIAWTTASHKSATYDEPLEIASAYAATVHGDYRLDYEHPVLWKYWAWLGNAGVPVKADLSAGSWRELAADPMKKWDFAHSLVYGPGNDPHRLVAGSRAMMLAVAVALGAVIGWWAWRLAGGIAAVVAVALFSFDPNFIGHGPLVKNDVAISLVTLAVLYVTWGLGRRVTWGRAAALGLLCGVGLTVKLSAILLGPIVAGLLLGRALLGGDWTILGGRRVERTARKAGVAIGLCLAAAVVSYVVIWTVYGFRYAASPDPSFRIDTRAIVRLAGLKAYYAKDPTHRPSEQQLAEFDPGLVADVALKLDEWHALPESWLAGVLFMGRNAIGESSYLNGRAHYGGTWYYFLEAMAVKTPTGTIMAFLLAAGWWALRRKKETQGQAARGKGQAEEPSPSLLAPRPSPLAPSSWSFACLAAPAGVLLAASCFAELNLGIRYIFPVYPLLYVLLGATAAAVWSSRAGRLATVVLTLAVAAETLAAYPNYIAFFNSPSGGQRGGLYLLGDSNLDWGQDLPAVADWQKRHPDAPLYLAYFGMADPAAWGIRYHNLPPAYKYGPKQEWPTGDAYMLISVTNLQGIYLRQDLYEPFRTQAPEEILGGSIYVYHIGGE